MTTTEGAPKNLVEALARVQSAIPAVTRDQVGKIKTDRANYEYRYADLSDVTGAIMPLLGQNGLAWVTQPTLSEDSRFVLRYTLMHSSGEKLTGEYPLPDPARTPPQQVGSALTYARRYCLCAVTGVAPGDDDDDAAAASREFTRTSDEYPPQRRSAPPRDRPERDAPAGAMSEGSQRAVMALFTKAGFKPRDEDDRARRLRVCASIVGHPVTTARDLTDRDAKTIIAAFGEHKKDVADWLATLLGEKPGDGPQAGDAPATPKDVQALDTLMASLGVKDDEAKLRLIGLVLESDPPASLSDLTSAQIAKVRDELGDEDALTVAAWLDEDKGLDEDPSDPGGSSE